MSLTRLLVSFAKSKYPQYDNDRISKKVKKYRSYLANNEKYETFFLISQSKSKTDLSHLIFETIQSDKKILFIQSLSFFSCIFIFVFGLLTFSYLIVPWVNLFFNFNIDFFEPFYYYSLFISLFSIFTLLIAITLANRYNLLFFTKLERFLEGYILKKKEK